MTRRALTLFALLALVALLAGACAGGTAVGVSPTPHPPLEPAHPGADPFSLLSWLFTPIFQALFIGLVLLDNLTGDIGIAILLLTLAIRVLLISPYRKQLVSQRRTQLLAPEVAEIQRRYKGDRTRIAEAQRDLYKSRGVNPLSGCLPTLLQFFVLIPMYTVIQNGLTNPDPTAMLSVLGFKIDIACVNGLGTSAYNNMKPCIDTVVPWIGNLDVSQPWAPIALAGIGISPLAIGSALFQVIQTRMTIKPGAAAGADANAAAAQNQSLVILPFISVLYGGILPAGLFIYWIASTVFSLVQQFLILGYGGLFPLFGWTPAFAVDHAPRFPVAMPEPVPASEGGSDAPQSRTDLERAASAAATIRTDKKRDRQGRRRGK
jgi:YidC/Oxa1 family membrane protein insertase